MGQARPDFYRSILTFSARVNPPRTQLVYVLKAYFDDSGSPDDPQHSFVTVAGYLADQYGWECFEEAWNNALREADIPYLHMREFSNIESSVYKDLRADKRRHIIFMLDAVASIADHLHVCISSTVRLADLNVINERHQIELDPLPVAIYGCICKMRQYNSRDSIEFVLDRFDKSISRTATAMEYARTDVRQDLRVDQLTPIPLQDGDSFRTILPLQAGDFVAWEVRKSFEERKGFSYTLEDKDKGREHMSGSYLRWVAEQEESSGKPPRERKSYLALRKALGLLPFSVLLDEFNLEQMVKSHPDGWST